jgi:chorismate mutase
MDKKKISIVRKKLDKLDYKILLLIKKRTTLVNEVIKIKTLKKQIVDKSRIKKVLSNIKKKSLKIRVDPKITNSIWSSMIQIYINYEKRKFKKK